MGDCYIKKIEQIDSYISTWGRYAGSIWDPSRLVVVEHDAAVFNESIGMVIPSVALSTNWKVDAEWHYADRGGLIMNLPDGYDKRDRFEYEWEDWCRRHKFKPNFGHRDQPPRIEGRNVNIDLLVFDGYPPERSPEERLRRRLRYNDFEWDEGFTFSRSLKLNKIRNSGYFGAEIPDEIVVFTSSGTDAYRIHIGDMYNEDEYADWLHANP